MAPLGRDRIRLACGSALRLLAWGKKGSIARLHYLRPVVTRTDQKAMNINHQGGTIRQFVKGKH